MSEAAITHRCVDHNLWNFELVWGRRVNHTTHNTNMNKLEKKRNIPNRNSANLTTNLNFQTQVAEGGRRQRDSA